MRLRSLVISGFWLSLLCACGGSAPEAETSSSAPVTAKPRLPEGSLGRDEVVAIVDEGLGAFLGRVSLEPSLEAGRFRGFRVLSLQPDDFWRDVDLQPGDVVLAVNGNSVEEPVRAFEVFESLRTAPRLEVTIERAGRTRQLTFPIVGEPRPAPAAKPSAG